MRHFKSLAKPITGSGSQYLSNSLIAFLLCIVCMNPLWADDTEIFFGSVPAAERLPNVLIVLDASGSMTWHDCKDGRISKRDPCGDGTVNGDTRRIERVQAALVQVISDASNINLGMMRFSNEESGGRVIYPLRDVELRLCDGAPCDPDSEGEVAVQSTVRQALLDTLNEMEMGGHTPTVGAMLEAMHYLSGSAVEFGKRRAFTNRSDRDEYFSRVSHPDSYTGGNVDRDPLCTEGDLSDPSCVGEEITGDPVYISPINNECQANHILLVTDGEPTGETDAIKDAETLVGGTCEAVNLGGRQGECAIELARHMAGGVDLRPDNTTGISGNQTATTNTIGFFLDSPWLEDVADAGGGDYISVTSRDQLVEAVQKIIGNLPKVGGNFVSPGVTVDQFSRLSHREDVYFSLFTSSDSPQWSGNVKHYNLTPNGLEDGTQPTPLIAVDETGSFVPESRSFWSDAPDGHAIEAGGAASQLPHYDTRKVVTYTGTEENLFADSNALVVGNTAIELGNVEEQVTSNLALTGFASQSSTGFSGTAGRAIDNNTNGRYHDGSTTHTQNEPQPWWQVALNEPAVIEYIRLWNRTDCCKDRIANAHVFVSDDPIIGNTVAEIRNQSGIWHHQIAGTFDNSETITLPGERTGQYVRVMLNSNSGTLSLAEVQVHGIPVVSDSEQEREQMISWLRGQDVRDDNGDTSTTDVRHHMGDPLHSKPLIVTYGGTSDDPDSVVYVGTNEGFLHALNSRTGVEEYAYMPRSLLPNVKTLFENSVFDDKVYGVDGDLSLWAQDTDNDGFIEAGIGDKAYLYAGMRRGGSKYFALDVSERDNPKFKFSIPESDPVAFAELGQAWSKPILASVKDGEDIKKVLIFAGGYDESQDDQAKYTEDGEGRAIYIVDAENGKVLWSAQPTADAGDNTKAFEDMKYSIPSDMVVIDADGDGLASQLYVGDMGGQVWRFDIHNDGSTGAELADGGVIATLGEEITAEGSTTAGARRFFHAPDLSLSKYNGVTVLNVGIGSGYQAHPLDLEIDDKYFLFRYPFKATGNYGFEEDGEYRALNIFDLYDATENLVQTGNVEVERGNLADSQGWRIDMERPGEKILGASTTLDHVVRFASYVPAESELGPCFPDVGSSYFYKINIADGTPVVDPDPSGVTKPTKELRYSEIPGKGLAPPVQTIFVAHENQDVTPTTVSGVVILEEGDSLNLTRRWFWAESPE